MIYYLCKYTPIEILQSFGEEVVRLEPQVADFGMADKYMHNNVCSYVKAVLEEVMNKNIQRLCLVNSCDSIRRLYDVLKHRGGLDFLYLLDLPRKRDAGAINLFEKELEKFVKYCEGYFNQKFEADKLVEQIKKGRITKSPKPARRDSDGAAGINVALTGARTNDYFIKIIEEYGMKVKYNYTCTGREALPDNFREEGNVLVAYAQYLLDSFPCLRMLEVEERSKALESIKNKIDGIIYHAIKFCDFYSMEYNDLKKKIDLPMLKVETDYTTQSYGQLKTRIGALAEKLKKAETSPPTPILRKEGRTNPLPLQRGGMGRGVYVAGIDSGSQSTNVVILDQNKNIKAYSIVETGARSLESAHRAYDVALNQAGLKSDDIAYVVSTGYGRVSIPFANEHVTEITCHAKGAFFSNADIRTIIDVGGQDSKVIRLDGQGNVKDFAMNDKCAAGTGKFLQAMARTLEVPLEEMGDHSLRAKEEVKITSMCTVFAESEVISLIPQNKDKADIIKGIHASIVRRTISLLDRVGRQSKYMMTGGVAKNIGVVKELEEKIGEKICLADEPQIVGALGAALFALEYFNQKNA